MNSDIESRPVWDAALAESLVGKALLVGMTYQSDDGSVLNQEQFYGTAVSVHSRQGIALELAGQHAGEGYTLPPDTRSIEVAASGEYRLRVTGEVVCNPDFTVMFTLSQRREP